jgi:protein-disulfide isomerase
MDSQNLNKGLLRLKKKEIIRMLRKEGIEPNDKQSKEELIKLLGLAKKANEPSRASNKRLFKAKGIQPIVLVTLTLLVACSFYFLYKLNPTFNRNINFLVSLMEVESRSLDNPNDPTILEKNGKTYVVYNHPLIDLEVFYDQSCKRPECEIDPYLNQIKKTISPLVDIEMIDISDPKFDSRTEKIGVNLLPTFAFDKTVEKLGNFEEIKDKFISRSDDEYLLQVLPYRTIKPLNTDNAKLLYGSPESDVKIVTFLSLSSEQSANVIPYLETISKNNNEAAVYYKYFFRNETDEKVAKSLECAADLDRFVPMFEVLASNYANIEKSSADRFRGLLNSYVVRADITYADFFDCYDSENEEIDELIQAHKDDINMFGVVGAPAVFVNNAPSESYGVILGYYPENEFMKLVDDILNQENQSNLE